MLARLHGSKPNFRKTAHKCVTQLQESNILASSFSQLMLLIKGRLEGACSGCWTYFSSHAKHSPYLSSLPHLSRSSAILVAAETARKQFFMLYLQRRHPGTAVLRLYCYCLVFFCHFPGRHTYRQVLEFGP